MLKQTRLVPHLPADTLLLDNAAGAGCVTAALFRTLEMDGITIDNLGGLKVICGDIEPTMLENVSQRIKSKGWSKIVESQRINAIVSYSFRAASFSLL